MYVEDDEEVRHCRECIPIDQTFRINTTSDNNNHNKNRKNNNHHHHHRHNNNDDNDDDNEIKNKIMLTFI